MQSVLNEILRLRNQRPILIDYQNSNRYRLITHEDDGSKTAYCFSAPIYNFDSRKMVDLSFAWENGSACFVGSSATVIISDKIRMQNAEGFCVVGLPQVPTQKSGKEISCGQNTIYPTLNGFAMKANTKTAGSFSFTITVEQPFVAVRSNDKYFALMREKFRPFVCFSCIGTLDSTGNIIAPALMRYKKLSDNQYKLTVSATSPIGVGVLFEGNLYENKLFQDTTVESSNPKTNNAFGSTAFVGNTALFGAQWLYSRPDYSRISELMDKRINYAILHMPKYNKSNMELSAFRVVARFCSFGSNWDNKVEGGTAIATSTVSDGYYSIDLTNLMIDPRTKTITRSEGLILKPKVKGSGFSVIATADSSYSPQILEVNYR